MSFRILRFKHGKTSLILSKKALQTVETVLYLVILSNQFTDGTMEIGKS